MTLSCPTCTSEILAQDINIENLVAKCHQCNAVFSFEKQVRRPSLQKNAVMLPPGFESFQTLSALDIEINWRLTSGNLGFFLFFTLLWNGIVSVFVFTAILSGEYQILLFVSLHLAVGLGLLYYIISMLVNKTYIMVNRRELSIEHRPIRVPFYPGRALAASQINQLYIQKYVAGKTNGNPNYAYAVYARLNDGEDIQLLKGLKHAAQARYVEQQIEKFLHIEDRLIEEEYQD